jgi:hypothetical protein
MTIDFGFVIAYIAQKPLICRAFGILALISYL